MATPLTAQEIIEKFEIYTSDTTELSSSAELDLCNKIYQMILANRPWYFLYKTHTPTITTDVNGIASFALPNDFSYIPITSYETDISSYGADKVIFVGPTNQPYKVINFTDRRKYENIDGFCYIDMAQNKIVFTKVPQYSTASYDYIYNADDLELTDSPIFPAQFHPMIYHGMVLDDMGIQLFDKNRSYANENWTAFQRYLNDFSYWNSQFYAQ